MSSVADAPRHPGRRQRRRVVSSFKIMSISIQQVAAYIATSVLIVSKLLSHARSVTPFELSCDSHVRRTVIHDCGPQ